MFLPRLCRRFLPTLQCRRSANALVRENNKLTLAVTEAKEIVKYSSSSSNIRRLIKNELADIARYTFIDINHPFLKTVRKMFSENKIPSWSLITLLVSKAYGIKVELSEDTFRVLQKQDVVAAVTEMIRISVLIHKSIANIEGNKKSNSLLKFRLGNKTALLSGDYLLSKVLHKLAELRTPRVFEIMSLTIRDLSETEFLEVHGCHGVPLPSKPTNTEMIHIIDHFGKASYDTKDLLGNPVAEWTIRNILGSASLLGSACQSCLMLANHPEEVQHSSFVLGKCIALSVQAKIDQEAFEPGSSGRFSLVSAPVMLHLKKNPDFYDKIEIGKKNALDIDYECLRAIIQNSSALEDTQKLQQLFSAEALSIVNKLPKSNASAALERIIHTLTYE